MPLTKRSQARVLALQALCAVEVGGEVFERDLDGFLHDCANYEDLGWGGPPEPALIDRARRLARGAWREHERYDALLRAHVAGWSLERMQPVDRNVLRLGLHELLEYPETSHAVVINEAIELARAFGGNDSPAFVNGVLDSLRRKLGIGVVSTPDETGPVAPPAQED